MPDEATCSVNVTIHPWCSDPSRDEAVRAAEDGRTEPLPTLEECIGMLPKSGSASSVVDHENKGQSMREKGTKRDEQAAAYRAEAIARPFDDRAYADRMGCDEERDFANRILDQRDAAIREREELRASAITKALTADRFASAVAEADVLRARVAELEAQTSTPSEGSRDAAAASVVWFVVREMTAILRSNTADADEKHAAMATLVEAVCPGWALTQAASGGGGLTPHQWNVLLELHDAASAFRDSSIHAHQVRLDKAIAAAERLLTQPRPAVPASGGGEQPRGWLTEEEIDAVADAADTLSLRGCGSERRARILRELLARSTPPEVVRPGEPLTFRYGDNSIANRDGQWISALAAAGVAVKEVGRE